MRTPGSSTAQSRAWIFTDFKLDRLDLFWKTVICKKLWIGLEVCPSTGRQHLQGFILWLRPYRDSQLKKLVPGAHWQPAKMIDAENYSLKEDLVLRREMTDSEEKKLREERQWSARDYRDAATAAVRDGQCNKCIFEAFPGYMFAQAPNVFRWRYYMRNSCDPPWKKEEWCQQCGAHLGSAAASPHVTHDCLTCTKCGIKAAPPTSALKGVDVP